MAESCWQILGIAPTKDKLAIKRAFAKLAHTISPEDDPDGYRRIHDAYKEAMAYASGQRSAPFLIRRVEAELASPSSKEAKDEPEKGFDFSSVSSRKALSAGRSASDEGADTMEGGREENAGKSGREDDAGSKQVRAENTAARNREDVVRDFDFSAVVPAEKEFSEEIEAILDDIVRFKEEKGIDTEENVSRWYEKTRVEHAIALFEKYKELYRKCDEPGVWNVFFKEAVVRKEILNSEFRNTVEEAYGEETEAGKVIREHYRFIGREHCREIGRGSGRGNGYGLGNGTGDGSGNGKRDGSGDGSGGLESALKNRAEKDENFAVWLGVAIAAFFAAYITLLACVRMMQSSKALFPAVALIGGEICVYSAFRCHHIITGKKERLPIKDLFEASIDALSLSSCIIVLANVLYWGYSGTAMTEYGKTNIIIMAAGGIVGAGLAAVFVISNARVLRAGR